jgi:phospholipid transport system substrate-binding protein
MKTLLRAALLALAPLALAPLTFPRLAAAAQTPPAGPPEAGPVQALDTALTATAKASAAGQSFQARYDALDPVIVKNFDLPLITRNSVGFLWSTLPAGQQSELGALFETFTVASYVSQFAGAGGAHFNLLAAEKPVGDKRIVQTQIIPGDGGAPTEIDYLVAPGADGWRIDDVLLSGTISQVAVHSSDFSAALQAKVAALSGAAGN